MWVLFLFWVILNIEMYDEVWVNRMSCFTREHKVHHKNGSNVKQDMIQMVGKLTFEKLLALYQAVILHLLNCKME